ncbi:MAG TPA: TonB-dependent receptor, partial [Terriglobales bacterium]|nr:TonB-dependent receptor [Terriglobales bacterium]
ISFGQEIESRSQEADRNIPVVTEVIVTGSNIPTEEEVGPNPVDTYRPEDIEKLGARNATDLLTKLPQEMGSTINQNITNGGDGSVIPNLRGLLPKETLVLIDGKRAAIIGGGTGGASPGVAGVDINLIPFPMIDHIDILKDGASAIYGSDAVAGVFNIFLKHKFRGLEIGGSIGNTNLGSSNDARELETWMIAGTGNDKTDIMIIADAYDRAAIYSRDRNISRNANYKAWGGFDTRSINLPGRVVRFDPNTGGAFQLLPGIITPTPHAFPNVAADPQYINIVDRAALPKGLRYPDGDFQFYNFAALTPSIPAADRQSIYGSFNREICDKYLEVFADFKYTRSFFDAALAATPFVPDAFKQPDGEAFSPIGISVPIQNPFNPFTVADATLPAGTANAGVPVTTGVLFRAINDTTVRTVKTTFRDVLFDVGARGQMGEFGDYFKNWNWELGFRYSRNEEENLIGGVVSRAGLRAALLDTNPATAFNPFFGYQGRNTEAAIARVYVTLHATGQFELPLAYFHINGDLFNLPAGPVSFAAGLEYRGERWRSNPDSENTSFDTIGATDFEASKVNRDVWGTYQEVRIPVTSPSWNFSGAHSLELGIAEREEWYSQNTSATSVLPAQHSQFNAQKPKFSVRWQPLDPKWIGTLTLRGTYSEAFHAPTLPDLTPAGEETFAPFELHDPKGLTPDTAAIRIIETGNPLLKPEVAYEWSYGAVYSPNWIKGLTLSADFWHIDLRSIASSVDAQFIIDHEDLFPQDVIRDPTTGAITDVVNPSINLTRAVVEGLDYEAIYSLDSSNFGRGDFGRFTFILNGTYLSRFEFQASPDSHRIGLSGGFVTGANFTGSLPHTRAFASAFWDGPAETWLAGFDIGATVHYTGQYQDDNINLAVPRKIREWTTFDVIASYTFRLPAPVAQQEVAGYAKDGGKNVKMPNGKEKNVVPASTAEYGACGWRAWLNGTTITLGMQNVLDSDPPFVAGSFENGYDESLANAKGRFWYVQLKKRF